MNNFKITKTILENINEQNDRINECVDIVNGYTTDEVTRVNQELQRQENELRREEQYNNIENRFVEINEQLESKAKKEEVQNVQNQVNNLILGAVGDGNNAEVVASRGSFSTLPNRLDKFDTNLNEIRDKFIIDYTLQSKEYTLVKDTYIYDTGWFTSGTTPFSAGLKLNVEPNETYLITCKVYGKATSEYPIAVFFEDETKMTGKAGTSCGSEKIVLSGNDSTQYVTDTITRHAINVPSNAHMMYINARYTSSSHTDIQISSYSKIEENKPIYLDTVVKENNEKIAGISGKHEEVVTEDGLTVGYVSIIDGTISTSVSRKWCKIDVSGYDKIIFDNVFDTASQKVGYLFKDSNETYISGANHKVNEQITVDIPINAKYFIYSKPADTWQSSTIFILGKTNDTLFGVQEDIKQCFQYVSNGKSLVASAITDKGIPTDATDTFQTMANNISSITTGDEVPLTTFAIVSDTHYYKTHDAVNKLNKALENLSKHSYDFLINCGDVGTFSAIEEEGVSRNIVDYYNYLQSINWTKEDYYIRGNHDQTTTDEKWVEYLGNEPNLYFERNGDLYIFLSMDFSTDEQTKSYTKAIEFLKTINVTNKRCFVFVHYPFFGKAGLRENEEYGWSATSQHQFDIYDYFDKNVVIFGGHTHFHFQSEQSIPQYNMNVHVENKNKITVHCPSTGYARDGEGNIIKDIVVQGWFVDVYKKGIRLRAIDLYNNEFLEDYFYHINIMQ